MKSFPSVSLAFMIKDRFSKRVKIATFLIMVGALGVASIGYPFFVKWFLPNEIYQESIPVFWILIAGLLVGSVYRPFAGILLQAGRPGLRTLLVVVLLLTNIIGNLLLIPHFGMNGAAAATATAFALESVLIVFFTRRFLDIHL